MSDPQLREALSEALGRLAMKGGYGLGVLGSERLTADLLPTVERIAQERAAAEIRAIAHRLDDGGDEAVEVALGGAPYVHRVLCDCAHALDGKP